MEKKIYLVNWAYKHGYEYDNGSYVYTTIEEALKHLKANYKQGIENITPNNKKSELSIDEFDSDNDNLYYYVERYEADSWWERGWIDVQVLNFED